MQSSSPFLTRQGTGTPCGRAEKILGRSERQTTLAVCNSFRGRMVAEALRNVRGRLCQRSDPEPIGCSAESNQPHVLPLGPDNSRSQIAGSGRSDRSGVRVPLSPTPLAMTVAGSGILQRTLETGMTYFVDFSSACLATSFGASVPFFRM